MNKYKTLLFDLDGVILDFKKAEEYSFSQTFKKIGIEVTDNFFQTYHELNQKLWKAFELGQVTKDEVTIGRFKQFFELMNIDYPYERFAKDYQDGLADGYFLMPNAKELLEDLSKSYRLFAVTNGVSKTALKRLKGTDTLQYFQDVFVSEDLHAQKPSMEYFNQVFERIEDFDPKTTLLIGDSLSSDIQGANNASLESCWINLNKEINSSKAVPTYEVHQLIDLYKILVKRV